MLEFKSIKEILDNKKITMLVYGDSGMGKTRFAGTFPGLKMWIELEEDGLESVKGENVKSPKIKTFQEFEEFLENLPAYHEKFKFKTLVIDTMRGMQNMFFRDVRKKEIQRTFDDWNAWSSKLVATLSFLKQASKEGGFNVVYIAHQKNFTPVNGDGEHTEASWGADLNQANSTKLHAMVDIAMKMEIREFKVLDKNGKPALNRETGKLKSTTEFVGIIAKSEGNQVKIRTTFKGILDNSKELYFKNPSFYHFEAIKRLSDKGKQYQTLENIIKVADKLKEKGDK